VAGGIFPWWTLVAAVATWYLLKKKYSMSSQNQKLATKAYKLVENSGQYKRNLNGAMNKAHQLAQAAHKAGGRKGNGPTKSQIFNAALNYEVKQRY
jgi:hypothetical protein